MSDVMPRETAQVLSPVFGDQAARAYASGRMLDATGPRAWTLFAVLMSIVAVGLAMALAGKVEIVATGHGRLVQALEVVTFLPERDGGFVEAGQDVRVELESGDLGVLHAKVVGAGVDDQGTLDERSRVVLEIVDDEQLRRMKPLLRPGTRVRTRHILRTRRAITLVLDPLNRWLD